MKYKKFLALAVLPSLVCVSAQSQAENLQSAVRKALEQHPTIQAAMAVEERIQDERAEEKSGLYPEVSANLTGGRIFGDNSTTRGLVVSRGEAYSYLWEGSASLTQPLFDGMQTYNRIDAVDARLGAQEYTVSDVTQNLALRAVQSYLNVMRTREATQSIENYRETLKAYQDRIQLMVDEGAADEAEVAQAKNISLLLQGSLADFHAQVDTAEADYIEIMGALADTALIKPEEFLRPIEQSVDAAVEGAKLSHPVILAAKKTMEASGFSAEAEKGSLYPTLDGELSYLKRDQVEEIGGEAVDGRALLRMNWDFSLGGGDLARIRQAKAEHSENLAKYRTTQREVIRNIRQAYALYDAATKKNELVQERLKITSDLFDTYKVQFEGALVSLLQLMQTENQMFNTKLEAINAEYEYLTAFYALMAARGELLNTLNVSGFHRTAAYDGGVHDVSLEPVDADESRAKAKEFPDDDMSQEKVIETIYPTEDYIK